MLVRRSCHSLGVQPLGDPGSLRRRLRRHAACADATRDDAAGINRHQPRCSQSAPGTTHWCRSTGAGTRPVQCRESPARGCSALPAPRGRPRRQHQPASTYHQGRPLVLILALAPQHLCNSPRTDTDRSSAIDTPKRPDYPANRCRAAFPRPRQTRHRDTAHQRTPP